MKNKKYIYYIISFAVLFLLPFILTLTVKINLESSQVLGIFACSLILWLKVDIGWPSVLCIFLLGLLPSVGFAKILNLSFGNSIFAFLMFTFICTHALSETNIIENIATSMITSKFSKKGKWNFVVMFMLAIYFIGLFVSPTVLYVIFFPIYEEICSLLKLKKGNRTAQFLGLTIIISLALSAGATPISHIFSIMAMGIYHTSTNLSISYLQYMAIGIPVTLTILIIWLLTAKYMYKPDLSMISNRDLEIIKKKVKKTSKKDKLIIYIFILIIFLWLVPDLIKVIMPSFAKTISSYGLAFPPIIGTILLSIIEIDGKPLVKLSDAMSNVQWPSLLMASSTIALGSVFTMKKIGLVELIKGLLSPSILNMPIILVIIIVVMWSSIQTNLSSNMVTVSVVTPIAMASLQSMGAGTNIMAITACLIGLMASLAYATPPAMPYVALTIGSKWISASSIFKYGLWMMLVSIIIAVTLGYTLGLIIF